MRALLPHPVDDVDILAFYADGWLEQGGVRVNFVSSVDGAAHADGKSRGLQTPGDKAVFAALRDLADVVLAGSGTVRAEHYRPVHRSPARQRVRLEHGLAGAQPIAVTSRNLSLDPTDALFTETEPGARTIVLTCEAASRDRRKALADVAEVVVCGDDAVDGTAARRALEDRGYTRILSEGGPKAFATLACAGVVDEVCLSLSPLLVGPGAGRISAGETWPRPHHLTLSGVLEDDGALFLRYRTDRRA